MMFSPDVRARLRITNSPSRRFPHQVCRRCRGWAGTLASPNRASPQQQPAGHDLFCRPAAGPSGHGFLDQVIDQAQQGLLARGAGFEEPGKMGDLSVGAGAARKDHARVLELGGAA